MNPDVQKTELAQFLGAMPRLDPEAVPFQNALSSQNIAYLRGQVSTRFGHSVMFSPNTFASSMMNWQFLYPGSNPPISNVLAWHRPGTGMQWIDLNHIGNGFFNGPAQIVAAGAGFASAGQYLYISWYDANGVGIAGGNVFSWNGGVGDPLFAAPTQVLISGAAEPAAGAVTAGLHKFGFLLQTRNGYTTAWSPVNSSNVFTPFTFTASGNKNLRLTLNGAAATWPTYASQVQIIMTTVANPNRYFIVPNTSFPVGGGSTVTYNAPDFSISDSDLTATATDAISFQNRLTGDQSGNAPFFPATIFAYGNRIGYVTRDGSGFPVCYFSNPNDYQALYAATSGVYLPGNLQQNCGFALRGVSYLVGPHWTYAVSDNGNVPAQWAAAQLVDGSIGTLAPWGVWVNEAQGYAWVCDEGGLYLFEGGSYAVKPISYYQQPDWARINWAAPTAVQVIDDKNNKRVIVIAPLDGATTPSHKLIWDYTEGATAETAKYSIDQIASYSMGALALVQHPTTKRMEAWYGPSSAGVFLRANDGSETNPYRDINTAGTTAQAIASLYETALLPAISDPRRGQVHFHHGDHMRVLGVGNLALVVFGLDHVRSVVPAASPIAMAAPAGLEVLFKYFLESEYASLQFSTNAVDAHFTVSELKHYWSLGAPQR